jgi:large subunit ribosomal protein L34
VDRIACLSAARADNRRAGSARSPDHLGARSFRVSTKRTYQPKRIPRLRRFGFLARMSTKGGRNVLNARRRKGRHALTVADEKKFTQNK